MSTSRNIKAFPDVKKKKNPKVEKREQTTVKKYMKYLENLKKDCPLMIKELTVNFERYDHTIIFFKNIF